MCVCVCVCVCVCGGGGLEAPLLFYKINIYRILSGLAHLNNEPDITMSYRYREIPA